MSELMYVLSAGGLRVQFGGVTALNIDRLDIPQAGTVTALLMGANGAGKTTFLDVVSGFVNPLLGATLRFRGEEEIDLARASRIKRVHSGLVRTFQHPPIFRSLTVRESIGVALTSERSQGNQRSSRVRSTLLDTIAESIGISHLLSHPTTLLPLHTLRRVELARVLATEPRLLILDEPTAGSDNGEREHLVELLTTVIPCLVTQLHAAGVYRFRQLTTCVVTHDLRLARQLSNRSSSAPLVHLLSQGQLRASGKLECLLADAQLRASYFGGS